MKKKVTTVYLSGPIDHATDSEMNGWRDDLVERWRTNPRIGTRNPLDRTYDGMSLVEKTVPIVEHDLEDIQDSDVILVNPNVPKMQGTPMEMVYGKIVYNDKLVILIMNEHVGPWMLYHSDFICQTLEEAINLIEVIAEYNISKGPEIIDLPGFSNPALAK